MDDGEEVVVNVVDDELELMRPDAGAGQLSQAPALTFLTQPLTPCPLTPVDLDDDEDDEDENICRRQCRPHTAPCRRIN